jgi:hypothetical protein
MHRKLYLILICTLSIGCGSSHHHRISLSVQGTLKHAEKGKQSAKNPVVLKVEYQVGKKDVETDDE